MLEQFRKWANNGGPSDEQKLRDISLEYREAELTAMTRNFDPVRRLGAGNYGAVYRGTMPDGHEVAIKVMEVDTDDSSSGFAEEVQVLSKFRHPNLVTLMGWGTGRGRRYLVYELLEGGDVCKRLHECRDRKRPFSWAGRLWVALDAACGLSHMHNSTPKAFHRDIKSANILLDRSGTAKMADFGLSGIANKKGKLNMTVEQVSGTPGYACPHYIKSGRVTEQTEVFAFGMVLLELLLNSMPACMGQGGQIIYPIFQTVMPQAAGAAERALGAVDAQAAWPQALACDLVDLSLACTHMQETRRPTFVDIGRRLRHQCEQHCRGQRPAALSLGCQVPAADGAGAQSSPPTAPQMNSQMARGQGAPAGDPPTRPQMMAHGHGAPGADPPTRPQMGCGHPAPGSQPPTRPQPRHPPPAGAEPPTRPQMGLGALPPRAGGEPPTRPQMGYGHPPQLRGADPPTRLQMGGPPVRYGPDGMEEPPTNPQMGAGPGRGAPGPPTRPQMQGDEPPTRPQMGVPGGTPVTNPQCYTAPGAGPGQQAARHGAAGVARDFFGAVQELWQAGWEGATEGQQARRGAAGASPAELAEVVLECVHSSGVDVCTMPLKHRCLVLQAGEGTWNVGRQQQPNLFARLVPDESLRACISRTHVVFRWDKPMLFVKKLSPNALHVNGRPLQQQEVPVQHDTKIAFCGRDNATPFLVFVVLLRDAAAVQAKGPTPVPTVPDTPAKPIQPSQLPTALQQQQQAASQRSTAPGALPATMPQPELNSAERKQPPQQTGPPVWYHINSTSPFSLVCVTALGCDTGVVPPERRTISLRLDAPTVVGREKQQGLFEGLLGDGAGQRYLCCVSRAHLELRPMSDRSGPAFEVVNLSTNPVRLSGSPQKPLGKDENGVLRSRDALEFLGAGQDGKPIVYLRMELEDRDGSACESPPHDVQHPPQPVQQEQQQPTGLARPEAAMAKAPAVPGGAMAQFLASSNPAGQPEVPATAKAGVAAAPAPPVAAVHLAPSQPVAPEHAVRAPSGPALQPLLPCLDGEPAGRPMLSQVLVPTGFYLLLGGTAVKEEFPAPARRLPIPKSGLTVGRAHQQGLHSEAFDKELRQYLSRDHFRIECGADGKCLLVPLSNNPIWRARSGELTEAVRGEPALSLASGDAIQLFTGAEDCTPDGPGSQGTLRWMFLEKGPGQDVEKELPTAGPASWRGRQTAVAHAVEDRDITPPPKHTRSVAKMATTGEAAPACRRTLTAAGAISARR